MSSDSSCLRNLSISSELSNVDIKLFIISHVTLLMSKESADVLFFIPYIGDLYLLFLLVIRPEVDLFENNVYIMSSKNSSIVENLRIFFLRENFLLKNIFFLLLFREGIRMDLSNGHTFYLLMKIFIYFGYAES